MNARTENIYTELLKSVKAEHQSVPVELKLELRKKLESVSVSKRKFSFRFRTTLAVAASILILIMSVMIVVHTTNDDSVKRKLVYESTVPNGKPVTIKLNYNAKENLEHVKFSIDLGEGVAFFSKNPEIVSLKSHSWEGSLKKGYNEIPFVVKTLETGTIKINTKAQYNNFSFVHEIILDAEESSIKVSMFTVENE